MEDGEATSVEVTMEDTEATITVDNSYGFPTLPLSTNLLSAFCYKFCTFFTVFK
jgi:hypothetical protein